MEKMLTAPALHSSEFARLSRFIYAEYGIKMPPAKRNLLESRLQKRLRKLEFNSFKKYCEYLFSPEGRNLEVPHFINQITTNKTDFFREPEHFSFLSNEALPNLLRDSGGYCRNIKIWSAGCSTGEEPYTLAIVLSEFMNKNPGLRFVFSILATDISSEVLQRAKTAVYNQSVTATIPLMLKKKYFLRNKSRSKTIVKIVPELRQSVEFKRLNFMDSDYGLKNQVDMIFCRNVLIYFDRPTQEKVLSRLCCCLKKGGYLFQGHSESVQGMNLPVKPLVPTVYQKN